MEFRRVLFRSVERRDLIAPRQCPWPLPARQPYRRFRGNAVRKQEMHAFSPEIDGNTIKALQHIHDQQRSDERRVGKERVSTCRSRLSPYHKTKNTTKHTTKPTYYVRNI